MGATKAEIDALEAEVSFMGQKLEESRKKLQKASIVVEYNNGGGQRGTRRNPGFDAYESLLASYLKASAQLQELRESAPKTDGESALSKLRLIGGSKRAV